MFANGLRKIDGYVPVNWMNKTLWQATQFLYGATKIGFLVPSDWLNKSVWDVSDSEIVGGHGVTPVGYNDKGVLVSSWGRVYLMTWPAFLSKRYMDEAYAMLAFYWYNTDQIAPNKFGVETLKTNLSKISQGIVPDLTPPTPPQPPEPTDWTITTTGPVTITGKGTKPTIK